MVTWDWPIFMTALWSRVLQSMSHDKFHKNVMHSYQLRSTAICIPWRILCSVVIFLLLLLLLDLLEGSFRCLFVLWRTHKHLWHILGVNNLKTDQIWLIYIYIKKKNSTRILFWFCKNPTKWYSRLVNKVYPFCSQSWSCLLAVIADMQHQTDVLS